MARVNVDLPDDLAELAQRADLNVSALAQEAIRRAVGGHETTVWLASLTRGQSALVSHADALAALDAAREDDAARRG